MTVNSGSTSLHCALVVGPDSHASALPGWDCRFTTSLPGPDPAATDTDLILVDADFLQQSDNWAEFPTWLADHSDRGPVILVYRDLAATDLANLFRAGLFDAIPDTAPPTLWAEVLARTHRRLVRLRAERTIQADSALTQQLLQDSRRRVRHESAEETAALLQAQTDLQKANQRLSDHMAQVSLLYQFGRELSLASNWDDTLREILANLAEFVGAAGGALVLRAASDGPYAPRQTYRWQEKSWDKVLLRITRQIDTGVASSLLAPGVFQVGRRAGESAGRITALPLEHQGVRLGMLLVLFDDAEERERRTAAQLPFLQMVQMVLSEEVASAQMLDRLRDISAFNTRVLETVSSAIWVCDGQGRTIFVNHAARGILGLDQGRPHQEDTATMAVGRGRMMDRPLTGGAELDDLPEIFLDGKLVVTGRRAPVYASLLRRKQSFAGEGQIADVQGESIPVRIQTAPMAGRGRNERWLLVILEDLREAKHAEAARRRAEQAEALVAMSATLAHEIRNPLMGLSAQAELLADSLPATDSRRDRIDLITGEVDRINRTITDMLQFVRPCRPKCEDLDPSRLIQDCLELARPRAEENGVRLHRDCTAGQTVHADPAQLQQVLLNLVLNAVDAAAPGGNVTVRMAGETALELADPERGVTRTVPGVVLTVEDDGPGFGAIDPDEIFEPFFTTKTTGTGLGLAYSRKVVDAHGGEIRAQREAALTRMQVLLPREAEAGKKLAGEAS